MQSSHACAAGRPPTIGAPPPGLVKDLRRLPPLQTAPHSDRKPTRQGVFARGELTHLAAFSTHGHGRPRHLRPSCKSEHSVSRFPVIIHTYHRRGWGHTGRGAREWSTGTRGCVRPFLSPPPMERSAGGHTYLRCVTATVPYMASCGAPVSPGRASSRRHLAPRLSGHARAAQAANHAILDGLGPASGRAQA